MAIVFTEVGHSERIWLVEQVRTHGGALILRVCYLKTKGPASHLVAAIRLAVLALSSTPQASTPGSLTAAPPSKDPS